MTNVYIAENNVILRLLGVATWLGVGALIGAFHFLTLRWNVQLFAVSQTAPLALALQLVRFAVLTVVLAVIASHFGALRLLVAATSVLAMRTTIVRLGAQP